MSTAPEALAESPTLAQPFKGPSEPKTPRMVDPDPKDIVLCSYPDTLDGFVAAWVVRRAAKAHNIPVEFQKTCEHTDNYVGRNVIQIGPGIWPDGYKSLIAFTLHKHAVEVPLPFKTWERTFPYGIKTMSGPGCPASAVCDPALSLAAIAWDFFNADHIGFEPRPRLIEHLNDYETKAFKFADTADIYLCVDSYERGFQTMDRLVEVVEDRKRREFVVAGGQAITRQMRKLAARGPITIQIDEETAK